jgi:hypothetical protein
MALILSFKSPTGVIYYGKSGLVSTKRAAKHFTGTKSQRCKIAYRRKSSAANP